MENENEKVEEVLTANISRLSAENVEAEATSTAAPVPTPLPVADNETRTENGGTQEPTEIEESEKPHANYMSMLDNGKPAESHPAFLSYIRPGFWEDLRKI